jgi:hypothetical protein
MEKKWLNQSIREGDTCRISIIRDTLTYMREFLHHFFLPRESNNHRPKFLHHQSLFTIIVLLSFLAVMLPSLQKDYPAVLGISNNITVQDLLTLTNQKRQEAGLSGVTINDELSKAAEKKGEDMFANNYWAHISPSGVTPWIFIKNSGYDYLYAGENLARGFSSASDVVNAWMASPSHRDNMLSPNYNDIGFAILPGTLTGSETILVVEMFGSKYLAGSKSTSTSAVVAVIPTVTPVVPSQFIQAQPPANAAAIASLKSQPLIDSKAVTKHISFYLLILFIVIFIVDAIIIERKKIARVVSHNLDHIFFLSVLLIVAIMIGKGIIL